MEINKPLVKAIGQSGIAFEDIAILAGTLSNYLVHWVQGKSHPDKEMKQRIADILSKEVGELWPE